MGELPADIRGESRLVRAGRVIWRGAFASGEANMSYSVANLEHHHFKYLAFRRPGDLHVHLFGCPVLSFAEGVRTQPGDVFEIEVPRSVGRCATRWLPTRARIASWMSVSCRRPPT